MRAPSPATSSARIAIRAASRGACFPQREAHRSVERPVILVRTYDFILWLLPHTARWPKALRHSVTERLECGVLDFQREILRANRLRGEARRAALDEADGLLDAVRMLVRLATDLRCLSARQYEFAAGRIVEIGRLLGAWRRATEAGRQR